MTGQLGLAGFSAPRAGIDWSFQDAVHSVESSEWYTPPEILDAGREAVGGEFDLDPASCEHANRAVRAKQIYTLETPLEVRRPWRGRLWINPPSPPRPWWDAAVRAWLEGAMVLEPFACAFLGYSIEVLQQSQRWEQPMMRFPFCIPKSRVRFRCTAKDAHTQLQRTIAKRAERGKGEATRGELKTLAQLAGKPPTELVKGDAPTHASVIVGVGILPERFERAFASIGEVSRGR